MSDEERVQADPRDGARGAWSSGLLRAANRPWLVSLVLMTLAVLVTFSHYLTTDWSEISGMGDMLNFFGPNNYYMDSTLHRGEFPLWNPLSFCGMPFAANPQVQVFYPLNLLRSLLTPVTSQTATHVGMVIVMGLHFVIGSMGAYFLAREHKLSFAASCVAGIGFVFGASMVRRATAYQFIPVVVWLPALSLFMRRAALAPNARAKLRPAINAGMVFSISLLGGFPQISCYVGVAMAAYYVFLRALHLTRGTDDSRVRRVARNLSGDAVIWVVLFVTGLLLASTMLIPGTELAGSSTRHIQPKHFETNKWPEAAFVAKSLIMYAGPGTHYHLYGTGISVLILALAGLTHRQWRDTLVFLFLYLVLWDCVLGPPMPAASLMERLLPFPLIDRPRAYLLARLPLAMLAAFGVDAVTSRLKHRGLDAARSVLWLGCGMAVLVPLARWVDPHPYLAVSKIVIYLPAATVAAMALAGWMGSRAVWGSLLAVLTFAEITAWTHHLVPFVASGRRRPPSLVSHQEDSRPWLTNERWAYPATNQWLYAHKAAINGYDPLQVNAVRLVLCRAEWEDRYRRWMIPDEVTQYNKRGHLFLKRPFWLARQYVDGPLPGKKELYPVTTTVFLENPGPLPLPRVEREDLPGTSISKPGAEVPLLTGTALPTFRRRGPDSEKSFRLNLGVVRETGPHSAIRFRYESDCRAELHTSFTFQGAEHRESGAQLGLFPTRGRDRVMELPLPDFRPLGIRCTVKILGKTGTVSFKKVYVSQDTDDEDGQIEILARTANSVEVRINDLEEDRVLTFIDAYYPGWHAVLDGIPVPILKANDAFKAVHVPPGSHTVRFEFRPVRVYVGVAVSCATLLCLLGAGVIIQIKKRRRRREADSEVYAPEPSG